MNGEVIDSALSWQAWVALAVLLAMIVSLVKELLSPDATLGAALAVLMATGVLSPKEALAGFANEGLLAIGALFIVAQAVQESGGLVSVAFAVLGRTKSRFVAIFRLMLPTIGISAFMNNTPVVAMFVPVVRTWALRNDIAPSKLLIPLSYGSILGGMCTLVGTSTVLIVSGMMGDHGLEPMGMFEITKVGLPAAIAGTIFMVVAGPKLLPERRDVTESLEKERREYLVEMIIGDVCHLIGKTVEEGGLRHLKGLFLVHIEREGHVIGPVPPNEVLGSGDRLRFTGLTETIIELKKIKGLAPAAESTPEFQPAQEKGDLRLFEVVIARSSPLVGVGVRQAGFRNRYNAAVIAVHRSGYRIARKIGDIVLRPGDTLLLESPEGFAKRWYNSTHFYLVSRVGEVKRIKHEKAPLVLAVLAVMVALPALGLIPMVVSAAGAAAIYVLAGVITPTSARRSIDLSVLILIAAALGVGHAIEKTGLAELSANMVVSSVSILGPTAALVAILVLTNIFAAIITTGAAAALFFPIAMEAAKQVEVDPRAFAIAVAIAAAASFATPLGYQTNLIVHGPGGYRFSDFLRVGVFMNVLVIGVAAVAIWFWWAM